jgi:HAMP domain-containing protein
LIIVAVLLLGAVRLFGIAQVSWIFLAGFSAAAAGANFGLVRLVRQTAFRPAYVTLTLIVGAGMISAVLYALERTGYVLYAAYLIAPLQAALSLGRRAAWTAVTVNVAGFAIVAALRSAQQSWGWSIFLQAAFVLAFTSFALIPTLTDIASRLRRTRRLLAQVERGDLAVRLNDPAADELGYLSASVDKTTATWRKRCASAAGAGPLRVGAAARRRGQRARGVVAAESRKPPICCRRAPTASVARSKAGAARRRGRPHHGCLAPAVSAGGTPGGAAAQEAHRHGEEIARGQLLESLVTHIDQASRAAGTLGRDRGTSAS